MSIENIKKLREITGAGILDIKKALDKANNDIDLAIKYLRESGVSKAINKIDRIATEGIINVAKTPNKLVIFEVNTETDFVAQNEKFQNFINELINVINNSEKLDSVENALNLVSNKEKISDKILNLSAIIGEKITLRRIKTIYLEKDINAEFYIHSNKKIGVIVSSDNLNSDLLKGIAMHIAAMNPQYLNKNDVSKERLDEEFSIVKKEMFDRIKDKPEEIQKKIINGKVDKILSESILLEQDFVKEQNRKIKDVIGKHNILTFVRFELGEGLVKKEENFAKEVEEQINKVKK